MGNGNNDNANDHDLDNIDCCDSNYEDYCEGNTEAMEPAIVETEDDDVPQERSYPLQR